ncbi:hypothetical protein HMPREF9413_0061 [Paenibacillus sp. HGF7]|nr:hypothetical protein HMPREF9413_0061 [Paenibacillus sp. HGF7]
MFLELRRKLTRKEGQELKGLKKTEKVKRGEKPEWEKGNGVSFCSLPSGESYFVPKRHTCSKL